MRDGWRCFVTVGLLLLGFFAPAAQARALTLFEHVEHYPLAAYLSYWGDASNQVDIATVTEQRFGVVPRNGNLAYDTASHWFKFTLINPTQQPVEWMLESEFAFIDYLALYEPHGDGFKKVVTGEMINPAERPWNMAPLAMPLNVAPGEQTYYVRMDTRSAAIISLSLSSESYFLAERLQQRFLDGLFYGAIVVVLLYNLFLFFSTSGRLYLLFSFALVPIAAYLMALDGLLMMAFPWMGVGINYLLPGFIGLACIFNLIFVVYLLNVTRGDVLYWVHMLLAGFMLALVAILPVLGESFGTQLILGYASLMCFYLFALGLVATRISSPIAIYFIVGWSAFWVSQLCAALAAFGFFSMIDFFLVGIKLSVLWTILWLSLGLGKKLKLMRDAEGRSEQAVLLAKAESQAKSNFLATMSHEIRTPLNGVMGMAELLKATGLRPEQMRIMQTMESSGQSLISVINDILDYSKIEAGKMQLESVRFNVDDLLNESFAIFKPRIYKQNLNLLCSVDANVPQELCGDAGRLRQVLVNLLSNAVKFTPSGRIDVQVSAQDVEANLVRLTITVKDTGIGIGPEQLGRIFDSFSQAESSISRQFGGTGLGLSISRQIARLMGGDVNAESSLGEGSRFWVTVTLPTVSDSQPRNVQPADVPFTRVLLVDADPLFLSTMQTQASLPYVVIDTAQSGDEALIKLNEGITRYEPYQWVVSALQLTDMNGLTLHERIKHDARFNDTSMMLFALPLHQPSPGVLLNAGVAHAFERPVSARELRYVLLDMLRANARAAAVTKKELVYKQYPHLKVLVAEDNHTNQLVILGLLKQFGIKADLVENGQQAVMVYEQKPYDLVFMDCEMPVMDGYSATKAIRSIEDRDSRQPVPVLAISAHVTQQYIENCYESGMDDHIAKPVSSGSLAEKLERWAS